MKLVLVLGVTYQCTLLVKKLPSISIRSSSSSESFPAEPVLSSDTDDARELLASDLAGPFQIS